MRVILLSWLAMQPALAAEVVWLDTPADFDRDRVANQAGATGQPLRPIDLRAAATAWSARDQAAYDALAATLGEVRAYETKLDGELLIMRDLGTALKDITLVRDDADRTKIYGALAYQGFAVNRYFMEGLATAEAAAEFRLDLDGIALELPWVDAVALDPQREVTPYDIAEAPQRVAYAKVQSMVARALPASLTPIGLPEGADLVVDGRVSNPGPAGNVKVTPGRHLVHVTLDGVVIARWDIRVSAGQAIEMAPELDEASWTGFLGGLADGAPVPEALQPSVVALGGEVWIARNGEKEPEVFALTSEGVRAVELEKVEAPTSGEDDGLVHATLGMHGAWFYGADFLLQNPTAERNNGKTVNAGSLAVLASGDLNLSGFQVGVGIQTWLTLGVQHVAEYAGDDGATRLRPYPHLAVGIRYVQATAGYLFPYHPAAGLRASIPITGPLEIQGNGLYGFKSELGSGAAVYQSGDVRTVGGGIGLRF